MDSISISIYGVHDCRPFPAAACPSMMKLPGVWCDRNFSGGIAGTSRRSYASPKPTYRWCSVVGHIHCVYYTQILYILSIQAEYTI